MLGRDDHRVDAGGLAVLVLHGDLALGVGPGPLKLGATLAEVGVLLEELVGVLDAHGHQHVGLVAGVAEHHALVASTLLGVEALALGHTLGDVGALLLDRDHHAAGVAIKALVRVVVADLVDHVADERVVVHVRLAGDLTGDDDQTGLGHGLAGYAGA